jgi:uncharacterized membrane protein
MKPDDFLNQLHKDQVMAAIRDGEKRTSGEIRVFVSRKAARDPVREAEDQFTRLGMTATRDRNGVLIYVAPASRQFAVVGDAGVHQRCGTEFWARLVDDMGTCFRQEKFTEGLLTAIRTVADLLATHFPRASDDQNELPDTVEHD